MKYKVKLGRLDSFGAKAHLDQGSMTKEQYDKYMQEGTTEEAVVEASTPEEAMSKINGLDGHCGVDYWAISAEPASDDEEVHPFYN